MHIEFVYHILVFLHATAHNAKHVLAIVILSVCPSQHGTKPRPFRRYQHRWLWTALKPKNNGF